MYDLAILNKINAEDAPDRPTGANLKIQKPKRKVVSIRENEKRPDANPNPDKAA